MAQHTPAAGEAVLLTVRRLHTGLETECIIETVPHAVVQWVSCSQQLRMRMMQEAMKT